MLWNYLKPGWRSLLRNKAYTTINILGLAMGISACLVIVLIARHELSYDTFHPGGENIYRVVGSSQFKNEPPKPKGYVPSPLPMHLREQVSGLGEVAGFYNYYANVTIPRAGQEPLKFEQLREQPSPIIVAEKDYFSIFHYEWLAGNAAVMNEPFQVVLTASAARKYFGEAPAQDLIGREVIYRDSLPLQVAGIVQDWKGNTDLNFTDFISLPTVQHSFLKNDIDLTGWGVWDYYSQAYVKLANGVQRNQLESRLARFAKDNLRGEGNTLSLQPLADLHFNALYEDGYSRKVHLPTLYGLLGIAVFILLIAVINFINLSTAQSIKRSKEIGIRKVLGSGRLGLRLQFFGETFLITLTAVTIAALMLKPVLAAFNDFIPAGLILQPFTIHTWVILLGITIVTTLLAGFYPARVIAAYNPVSSLKGQPASAPQHRQYLRKSLIVFQFTVSLVFIIGTLVVGKQIHYMLTTDAGFDKEAIINLKPGREETPAKKILLAQQLQQLPGVTAVSLHGETPAANRHGGTSMKNIGGNLPDNELIASFGFADAQYLPLYNIKLIAGRNLLPSDTLREFVINASCARALGYEDPAKAIGNLVEVGISGKRGPIVGVIEDFHSKSFREAINPFFLTTTAKAARTISVKLQTGAQPGATWQKTMAAIESKWQAIYPDKELNLSFFDETIASFYEQERKTARLMNTAMGMAIFISCIGLFGLAAFLMQQRTKEIGIRKVLGASVASITSLLSKEFLQLVLIATLIASPIAWYFMHRWLESFAYRTDISWWILVLAGAIAMVVTFCTIGFQAIKAAIANPVKSLRSE
ncbi:ABC transporter permease [Paraflavitalea sp. CAU 1676]|uniref:ABC transporter permease n=1 Tax=Paraflavitalea sp. CAU 1676 TaxID=3032598 RepID=UPI0023DB850B|nr:ABC transporter permease [Paraflavitalea sp. CAU 1676]MDF2192021.1 ABC transporter permease [Paraflavitalea sp. CAU 1676]